MEIELGKVVGVWGVKGWIKLHSYTRNRADIGQYSDWLLGTVKNLGSAEKLVKYRVIECREQGKNIVARLDGIDSVAEAQQLNGQNILIAQTDLPALPAGQYYWRQLVGLTVTSTEQVEFGVIASILETGANDVLIVKANKESESAEVLIPYTDSVVKDVNLEQGSMLVDWDLSYLE